MVGEEGLHKQPERWQDTPNWIWWPML